MPKDWTPAAAAAAVRLIYRRVLERDVDDTGLLGFAGGLDRGEISVRDVVRAVGTSDEYRDRFVIPVAAKKAAKDMYRRFLAREPESAQVVADWATVIAEEGFEKAVNGFIDSEEYGGRFGDDSVPG